ncbi:MAG: hypothetical protein IPM63_04810 [Acidobacteriota bacterium]|nr:MAG: hypothetical protein IPM63_04810 [Acidobacteriota bacterium]
MMIIRHWILIVRRLARLFIGRIIVFCLLATLLLSSCAPNTAENKGEPERFEPSTLQALIGRTLFGRVYPTGVAFLGPRLFVSSGVGLLEYENGNLKQVFKWNTGFRDEINSLTYDSCNDVLWGFRPDAQRIIQYDGKEWKEIPFPLARGERFSSGDAFSKLVWICTNSGVWLQTDRSIWRWSNEEGGFLQQPLPAGECFVSPEPESNVLCFGNIASVEGKLVLLMHRSFISRFADTIKPKEPQFPPDRVFYFMNGTWEPLEIEVPKDFISKEVFAKKGRSFVRTTLGSLYELTFSGVKRIENGEEILAVTVADDDRLIAVLPDEGILDVGTGSKLARNLPDDFPGKEGSTHIAEEDGVIAIVWTVPGGTSERCWLLQDGKLRAISFL